MVPSAASHPATQVSSASGSTCPGSCSAVGPAFAKSPVAVQPAPQPGPEKSANTVPAGGGLPYTEPGTYGWSPPPTRKFRYGLSTVKAGEVSVPVLASPPLKLLTRPAPV